MQLVQFDVFEEGKMGDADCDNKAVEPIEEAGPHEIAGEKGPEGIEDDLEDRRFFAFAEEQLRGHLAVPVVLGVMFVVVGIGDMEKIAFEKTDACVGGGDEAFVNQIEAPGTFAAIEEPQFAIGVPAAMTDPLTTIVIEPVHQIAVTGKVFFLLCENGIAEGLAQEFVGIEKKNMIVRGQGGGCIFLGSITVECTLEETASHFFDDDTGMIRGKTIEYDDLVRYIFDRIDTSPDIFFFVIGNDHNR
jgi:hypothetical protein